MKVYSFYMQKGGIGKTTITWNMGFHLSHHGKVLFIDCDQQGNLTILSTDLSDSEFSGPDFLSVLEGHYTLSESIVKVREKSDDCKGIYILGTKHNDKLLKDFYDGPFRDEPYSLRNILRQAEQDGFDYVLLDLSPSFDFFARYAFSNCNQIVPIVTPIEFDTKGLIDLCKSIVKLNKGLDCNIEIKNIIINNIETGSSIHSYWISQLNKLSNFTKYEIRASRTLITANDNHIFLYENRKTSPIVEVFDKIADNLK